MSTVTVSMRQIGEQDALAGKLIDAFYQIPGIRHSERQRAEYEIGWRAAQSGDLRRGA